jgi:hypothetical protein
MMINFFQNEFRELQKKNHRFLNRTVFIIEALNILIVIVRKAYFII